MSKTWTAAIVLGALLCTLSINSQANETGSKKERDPYLLTGIANCPKTIEQYAFWRSRALAVYSRDTSETEVIDWLTSTGLDRPRGNVFTNYVHVEGEMQGISGVYVECGDQARLAKTGVEGYIYIKYTDKEGKERVYAFADKIDGLYSLFSDRRFLNVKRLQDLPGELEPLPQEFYDEVESLIPTYQKEINEALGAKPEDLVFEENEVDLFFDWPKNTLMEITENFSYAYITNGRERSGITKNIRKASIEPDENGTLINFLAEGSEHYAGKTLPLEKIDFQTIIDSCIEFEPAMFQRLCVRHGANDVPNPYTIDVNGNKSRPISNEKHTQEVLRSIDIKMKGINNVNTFRDKIEAVLNENVQTGKYINADAIPPIIFNALHGKKMMLNETVDDMIIFDNTRDLHPTDRLAKSTEVTVQVQYKGKAACNEEDTLSSCIKIESELNGSGPTSRSWALEKVSLIIEPHTLLPYSMDVVSQSEEYDESNTNIVNEKDVSIEMTMKYQEME